MGSRCCLSRDAGAYAMKGGEARLWTRMRAGIADKCFVQRVENMVGEGLPDVILHRKADGQCAFVELKCRPLAPVRGSTGVFTGSYGLRPAQVAFAYSRASAGAAIFVLGQCGEDVWLVHGRYARDLAAMTRVDLDLTADWAGSARRTDWVGMLGVIFG